jgi:hypothetical protein
MWQSWISAILGLWVIAVPFTGIAGSALMWTLAVTGIVVAALSLWSAYEVGAEREEEVVIRHAHS